MTELDLAAIKARVERTTSGPWATTSTDVDVWTENEDIFGGTVHTVDDAYPRGGYSPRDDAEFIANARQDVPALVSEIERMVRVLDEHLPTIIHGLGELDRASGYKSRDELSIEEVAIRSAYSAAHHIAKGIAGATDAPLYDLPSVLDLMSMLKKQDAGVPTHVQEIEAMLAAKTAAAYVDGERDALRAAAKDALTDYAEGRTRGRLWHEWIVRRAPKEGS